MGKFFSPHIGELMIIFRAATMGRGLPWREAENTGLHSAIVIQAQRTAKAAGFVVGMSGYHHHAQHELIVA